MTPLRSVRRLNARAAALLASALAFVALLHSSPQYWRPALERLRLAFVAIPETLQRTSLGSKQVGQRVNLERALAANGRLDGHLVQGHIDDVGVVSAFLRDGSDVRLHVRCPPALARLLVPKGSVAIDGVSLTVVETAPEGFFVSLIPHTLEVTTLGERQPGDPVNLEADVIGKYVHTYLSRIGICPSD